MSSQSPNKSKIVKRADLPTIGWREWASLPDLGVPQIKAKIDTGARTSALHAFDLEYFERGGKAYVHFLVHPTQRSTEPEIEVEAAIIDRREVRSSNGESELRPVISTTLVLGPLSWPIELTLTRRDVMDFRFLLGRQALRNHVLIDPGRSYRTGRRAALSKLG